MVSLLINKNKVFVISALFTLWHLLDKYWESFIGKDWDKTFLTLSNGITPNPMGAPWFMCDLSEFLMILIVFLSLRLIAPLFQIKGFVIWDLYIGYTVLSILDFWFYQSQTDYNIREVLGILFIVVHWGFYFKYKEDEL